jgi:hypothetical protein
MSNPMSRRVVYSSLAGIAVLAVSSFFFINCASQGPAKSADGHWHRHHPRPVGTTDGGAPDYINCRGTVDCQESDWYPECGDYYNVTCIPPSLGAESECIFRVSTDTGCFCLERDIRNCSVSGDAGIQRCVALGGGATGWGCCGWI